MQRWEYRVVSLRDGTYTAALNDYGRDGWELVSVTSHEPQEPSTPEHGPRIPRPRAIGRLEDAAAKLNKLGASGADAPQEATSNLLWVLRRPLPDDLPDGDVGSGLAP
jgi:hypothetical protein